MVISETDSFVVCVRDWNILSTEPRIHTGRLDDIANHPLITWFDPAPAVSMVTRARDVLQSKLLISGPGGLRPSDYGLLTGPLPGSSWFTHKHRPADRDKCTAYG